MDSEVLNILALVMPLFLFVILAQKIGKNVKKTDSSLKLPPAPWKLPIIGNTHHLVTSIPPHKRLRDLAKIYGPFMHLQLGEVFTIIVSSPKYAMEIMKTHDVIFASRPRILASVVFSYECKDIAFSPYGDYWRQLRKLCTVELLTQKRVNSFQPIREEELANLVKMVASHNGSPINLTEAVLLSTYNIISRSAFGMKCRDKEEFISLLKKVMTVTAGFNIEDLFPSAKWLHLVTGARPKLERLHRQMDKILQNIIDEHKEAKSKAKEDQAEAEEYLVDILLKFQDGNDSNQNICLTINNIKAIIMVVALEWVKILHLTTFSSSQIQVAFSSTTTSQLMDIFTGGGEAESTTINWAMAEMIRNPRVMKKAQVEVREVFNIKEKVDEICINELKYLKSVVKETLRLHPPTPLLLPRECGQTCEIDGYHVPVKSKILINAWAIGRDPKNWTEPDRFYPERFIDSSIDYKGSNFEYIPFGAGRRICPGITYGLASVEETLAFLLYHFDWKLPNGMKSEDLDMTEQFGASVKRKDDLYLMAVVSHLGKMVIAKYYYKIYY
uniref:Cytochrome P450 71D11 n=1 Tax=Cajanus cajan TaxID=3821 RepID=A0A151QUA6_CAJCA|nr:Cytochrome P450 71D11 [Cajanus cajan]